MGHIDSLIEVALQEAPIANQLIVAIQHFLKAMELLLLHQKLDADEMSLFQDDIDGFFEIWVENFGREGMSNYIHLLGAGHILYFLEKYQCVYLYSQQGWEALNNTIQAYIHKNSQQGGKGSGQRAGENPLSIP